MISQLELRGDGVARAQVIRKVGPYIENPDFTPKAIEKASVACKAICMRLAAF